jgi:hypothetical protein
LQRSGYASVGLWGIADFRLRGGSWNNNAINARAAYRNNNRPDNLNNNIGVRLALADDSARCGQ